MRERALLWLGLVPVLCASAGALRLVYDVAVQPPVALEVQAQCVPGSCAVPLPLRRGEIQAVRLLAEVPEGTYTLCARGACVEAEGRRKFTGVELLVARELPREVLTVRGPVRPGPITVRVLYAWPGWRAVLGRASTQVWR